MRHQFTIAANAIVEDVRRETFEGVGHVVVPAVLVKSQVLRNNLGSTYLPADEIRKSVDAWNDMPVVIRHPTRNGEPVSARTPIVSDAVRVGRIYNAREENGALKAEIWLAEPRLEVVKDAERISMNIERGVVNELSTGFTTSVTEAEGSYNGEAYDVVMKNIQPDHLALLVDEPGACSVQDGCGLGVNEMSDTELKETFADRFMAFLRSTDIQGAAASEESETDLIAADNRENDMRSEHIAALVEHGVAEESLNAMSDCDLKALHEAVQPAPEAVEAEEAVETDEADAPDLKAEVAELKALLASVNGAVAPLVAEQKEARTQTIKAILADARCAYSEQQLAAMDNSTLDATAKSFNTSFGLRPAPRERTANSTPAYKAPKMYWDTKELN